MTELSTILGSDSIFEGNMSRLEGDDDTDNLRAEGKGATSSIDWFGSCRVMSPLEYEGCVSKLSGVIGLA